jgi:hypothetical protein
MGKNAAKRKNQEMFKKKKNIIDLIFSDKEFFTLIQIIKIYVM